jgi:glutamate-1-semialdehyde 2,1-aminomutase
MAVLRLARAYTERELILKFNGCYHGHADSLLVQAGSGVLTLGLPDSPGVVKGAAASTLSAPYNAPDVLEDIFRHHGDRIAAVIIEPVVGNSGFIMPRPGFLSTLRALCTKYGSLLIFDEVMTGFRVHKGGAQQLFDIIPDLTMLGKVIGGGLPVGAYGGRADIMKMIAPAGPVYQAGTLSGNPLAMTAGRVTLEEWCLRGHFEAAVEAARKLKDAFEQAARKYDVALQVEALGTMFGYFFSSSPVHSLEDTATCDRGRFIHFYSEMLANGVFFPPSQFEAGFISSSHDAVVLEETATALQAGFASVAQRYGSQP